MQHGSFRLSPQQQRLWLLQQKNAVYWVQGSIALHGTLQPAVLAAALRQVVARHSILRTTFYQPQALQFPLQCIVPASLLEWHTVDVQACHDADTHIAALTQRQRQQPVDFAQGPLLRALLLQLAPTRHRLLISLPALCADAWSLRHLLHEVSQAYTAYQQGMPLGDEPTQYVQFSEWQNALLEDADAATGKEYWQRLSTPLTQPLPFARQCMKSAAFVPAHTSITLAPQLLVQIQAHGASLEAFLLAAWQTLLWRLTGQALTGYVCDGRKYEELHGILGALSKWVPVQGDLTEDDAYMDLVEQTQKAIHAAVLWQEYFQRPDDTGDSGSVGFAFEGAAPAYHTAGISWTLQQQYVCNERFAVHLVCTQQEEALLATFSYDTEVFTAQDMTCLAAQWQTLLVGAASNPAARLGELPMLSAAQRQHVLFEVNRTATTFPEHAGIQQLFEAQAAHTPDRIAVMSAEGALTYAALNARANQLAHFLQKLGAGPEIPVALCLERSAELLVGLLGILKAGAAYAPLEPDQPRERLAALVAAMTAPVVVTQQRFGEALGAHGREVVCLDRDWPLIARERAENPCSGGCPENLAYIMYTSGSTGHPKGVAVEHRQLLNYVHAITARLELPVSGHFAVVSTFAADLGHTMLFPALCQGGCLHLLATACARDPEALAAYFQRHTIDCLKIVPSHLAALLTATYPVWLLPRQRLVLGGEACNWTMLATLQELAPQCRIFNHYGPTEATVGSLATQVDGRCGMPRPEHPPLGMPLANTQIYILDPQQQPVPPGVAGEIYIGGAGVARGYLHDSRLTAARFLPHPYSTGARLYRTGDRGRLLPDGSSEFLGRVDHQIKLRGFRIEPGEIETALLQHPRVRETVVTVQKDTPDNPQLLAYVVPDPSHTLTVQELRHALQHKLPDFMVPSTFIFLKTLPLTANGKVNRQALPDPASVPLPPTAPRLAPRNAVEEVLAQIWGEVLGHAQVSVEANFFELGGHSLLGIQVLSRVRQAFRIEVPPRELFTNPTIAGLAEALGKHEPRPGQAAAIARLRLEIARKSAEDVHTLLQDKGHR